MIDSKKDFLVPGLVAITGGGGFIGKEVVKKCIQLGWKVRILTRNPEKWKETEKLEVFQGDLVYTHNWYGFLLGVDVLIHAAGEIHDESLIYAVNVEGSSRLLNAALESQVKRWVQISSVGAYGAVRSGSITEDYYGAPVGSYEISKTQFDKKLEEARLSGIEVAILRPSNVFGPGMKNQSLIQMMRLVRSGCFFYVGPVGALVNYVHVQDVVDAIIVAATHPKATKTYNVSDSCTIEELVEAMASCMGVTTPRFRVPFKVALVLAMAMGWVQRWPLKRSRVLALTNRVHFDTTRIRNELGFTIKKRIVHRIKDLLPSLTSK